MATATISGSVTFNVVTDGPSTSIILGSPAVSPSSSTGAQVSFTESLTSTLSVPTAAPTSIPFGTIASANVLYIGVSTACTVILDGGAEEINLSAGGQLLLTNAGITSATVQADTSQATVTYIVLGD